MLPDDELEFLLLPDEVTERVLIIGGGIAGLSAAQELADAGYQATIIERQSSLGGNMARLESTFPTLEHAVCELREKMREITANPAITTHTFAELEALDGVGGDFMAAIRKKARAVNEDCNGCALCWRQCPVEVASEFDEGMGRRKAIFIPFPQATPGIPLIDRDICAHLTESCEICQQVCPTAAIDFEQQDDVIAEKFGAVILATGFSPFDPTGLAHLNYAAIPDVITSVQAERLLSGAGPTRGEMRRPSDGKRPQSVLFVSCVGSLDGGIGRPYCSRLCCTNIAKQAIMLEKLYGNISLSVIYQELRTIDRNGEDLIKRAQTECGAEYVRGKVAGIHQVGAQVVAEVERASGAERLQISSDLVILAVGMDPAPGFGELADALGIFRDMDGVFARPDPKLQPVNTSVPGIFTAGAVSGPLDISESLIQGGAAAVKAIGYIKKMQQKVAKHRFELSA